MICNFDDDILQPIQNNELPKMLDNLKESFPKTLRAHHFILMQMKWNHFLEQPKNLHLSDKISARCKFNLFKHRHGKLENSTIVAITIEGNPDYIDDYNVFVFSSEENLSELHECIFTTKRINWKLGPLFLSIESQHLPILHEFMVANQLEISWEKFNLYFWLPKEEAEFIEYEVPNDVYIKDLSPVDAEVIDSVWRIRSPGTNLFISSEIVLNWGLGVYSKDTNELLSWILVCENYCPGTLSTIESARNKGYGLLITKAFCKEFVKREYLDLIAFIIDTNYPSLRLFDKLHFREIGAATWLKIKRK